MDISRLKPKRSVSSTASSASSINLKSHHNISKEQPHRTFSLMTQNHQQHSSAPTTSTNTNSVMMMSLTPTQSSSSKSKSKNRKFGKDSYLDDNDDWLANVGEYTIEKEDKFISSSSSPFANKHDSLFMVEERDIIIESSDFAKKTSTDETGIYKNIDDTDPSLTIKNDTENRLLARYQNLLHGSVNIKINELRDISWHGIPLKYKSLTWKLLLGYLPPNVKRHELILKQKRQSYKNGILQSIKRDTGDMNADMNIIQVNEKNKQTWHQIDIDLKRTHPDIALYQFSSVKKSLQRILYYWAIRRPTTGYVQGINDICTTFYQVFLLDYYNKNDDGKQNLNWDEIENTDPTEYMDENDFNSLESDTFWCFDRFLESIMDNYVHGQPGILKQVSKLEKICKRIDPVLYAHFASEQVEFFQFAFRWMNCLLMREVPMRVVLRMWDTYLAESSSDITSNNGENIDNSNDFDNDKSNESLSSPLTTMRNNSIFNSNQLTKSYDNSNDKNSLKTTFNNKNNTRLNDFHVYVCCAFLEKWATTLESMDFTGIIMFLQSCPTTSWNEQDIEMLLSEAYLWQCHFKDS